jgi:hypothetical protein
MGQDSTARRANEQRLGMQRLHRQVLSSRRSTIGVSVFGPLAERVAGTVDSSQRTTRGEAGSRQTEYEDVLRRKFCRGGTLADFVSSLVPGRRATLPIDTFFSIGKCSDAQLIHRFCVLQWGSRRGNAMQVSVKRQCQVVRWGWSDKGEQFVVCSSLLTRV